MYSSVCFKLKVETHILSSRRQSQSGPGSRTETSRTLACLTSQASVAVRLSP